MEGRSLEMDVQQVQERHLFEKSDSKREIQDSGILVLQDNRSEAEDCMRNKIPRSCSVEKSLQQRSL